MSHAWITTDGAEAACFRRGTQPGQIAVIERTPTRYAIIGAAQGAAFVTNHYRRLDGGLQDPQSSLAATACTRLDRIQELVRRRNPDTPEECLRHLSDPGVKMGMTMQQMVFHAASGRLCIGATTQP